MNSRLRLVDFQVFECWPRCRSYRRRKTSCTKAAPFNAFNRRPLSDRVLFLFFTARYIYSPSPLFPIPPLALVDSPKGAVQQSTSLDRQHLLALKLIDTMSSFLQLLSLQKNKKDTPAVSAQTPPRPPSKTSLLQRASAYSKDKWSKTNSPSRTIDVQLDGPHYDESSLKEYRVDDPFASVSQSKASKSWKLNDGLDLLRYYVEWKVLRVVAGGELERRR